jgi:uncharacterized protein YegL
MRKLPIYLLVDCSSGMAGAPFQVVQKALDQMLSDFRGDPQILEQGYLSTITFGDKAEQICPLVELLQFSIDLRPPGGKANLGAAFELLESCIAREVRRPTPTQKGDWKPLVFLLSNGRPSDDWELALEQLRKRRLQLVALAPTAAANLTLLERITHIVVSLENLTPDMFRAFLKVRSDSVGATRIGESNPDGQPNLPPPPPGDIIPVPCTIRRLPIYFLVDCSPGLAGPAVAATQRTLQSVCDDLRGDPMALETAYASVIAYGDNAVQTCPLTEVLAFKLPAVKRGRRSDLGAGLRLLETCLDREVRPTTPRQRGDWKPVVFLLCNSKPTDDWLPVLARLRKRGPAAIIAVATGSGADLGTLRMITDVVIQAADVRPEHLRAFFKWVSTSIKTASAPLEDAPVNLPPPPPGSGIVIIP